MALEDFISKDDKQSKDDSESETGKGKLKDNPRPLSDNQCPRCNNEGERIKGVEYRCVTDNEECEVLTWLVTEFETDFT